MQNCPVNSRDGLSQNGVRGIAHDLGRAAGAHHGVAAEQIADRGGGDGGARPQRVDGDALRISIHPTMPSTHMLMPNFAIV